MNEVRIMHLNDSLDVGGAETMVLSLLTGLATKGYKPYMCSMQSGGKLVDQFLSKSIPVIEIQKQNGIDLSLITKLAKQLFIHKIKILHTHNYYAWFYGGLASLLVPGCLHVHTQHSHLVLPTPPHSFVKRILWIIPKKIIAVSNQVLDSLLTQEYISEKTVAVVIHNGIDTNQYSDVVKNNKIVNIGIVARLVGVKNHKMLIEAFAVLSKSGLDVELSIVGDGPLLSVLQEQCRNLGISEKVIFMGERSDVDKLLGTFDIYVLPSHSEGLSISILEAMASSLPIVATSVGGNPVLVCNSQNGFLVDDNDVSELARVLKLLILDRELRFTMGRKGRRIVTESFSLDEMVNSYHEIYQKLI